ncbi:MAG: monovalent cation:proton antiporter-2 (CPA2) family protein [Gammaproteobacteria bacterium]|nr:monovalent cation:proton antiporter-2 (CPA2) family protein [Gammaproteobacteria bacterium]MDH5303753.1 monovalent cation:proton antiporter-2 (CPA2) family protein [Gammaproteobacteria bacterium]MDH5322283.1 monovalent cation:proton antiporter-2 (CPA2) family protein [Gammaproteobacteria bacterium]
MTYLQQALIYIGAAVLVVPLARRLGLGSVLGYLGAGVIIGPAALGLIDNIEDVMHFAELGVVFLLFIIGLELKPSRLWVMRHQVFGFGSAQVLLTAALLVVVLMVGGWQLRPSLVIGFGLALSSTAFVLQLLAEQKKLSTEYGRASFAVLLLQDLAVIPLIALIPLLATGPAETPDVTALLVGLAAIAALIAGGRYLLRPALRLVAKADIKELFTAVALLVVLGAAALMEHVGLSMDLGAFIAGILLADSEYRHALEINIDPFKGLLLGLFFIAVGMSVNVQLLLSEPLSIVGLTIGLILAKALVLYALARAFGLDGNASRSMALILAQGGEFAFVLFTLARNSAVLDGATTDKLFLVVTLSMMATPILYLLDARIRRRQRGAQAEPVYDAIEDHGNPVIIASFGRFGQIVGRILKSKGIGFTALESNPEQVEIVRRYGNKVYFGDASKIELLRSAGTGKARFFVLAIDDVERSIATAKTVRHYFPGLPILARARDRHHAHLLMDLGITMIYRDTFQAGMELTRSLLQQLGTDDEEAERIVGAFEKHDTELLKRQHEVRQDEKDMIQTALQAAEELESLLQADRRRDDRS